MQEKLQKLFKEINLEEELFSYFNNATLDKVVVYDGNKQIDFILNTESVLPIEVYNNTLYKLISYFNAIENIRLIIKPSNIDNGLLSSYYFNILKTICLERAKYNVFLDRETPITDNTINIKTYNKIECTNMFGLKQELINKLSSYGFNVNINIDLIEEGDLELKNKIESEKEITTKVSIPISQEKPQKKEQEPDKKTPYRAKKSTEITPIKDVLYEVDNINILGTIFGIEYFESKSGYKIITLKVTDYTDSMYVKMFTKDDEEYALIKKLLKEGKWYNFYGKAAMDKYLQGRIKAYTHLFTEISPPVPKEHIRRFTVNGHLLPGYTVESEQDKMSVLGQLAKAKVLAQERFRKGDDFNQPPHLSPWGEIKECQKLCAGVFQVTAGEHSGIMAANEVVAILSPQTCKHGEERGGFLCFEDKEPVLRDLASKKVLNTDKAIPVKKPKQEIAR